VIICGGDGTINKIVAALLHVHVNIGILPMGSGNGLAFSAKIPASLTRALDIIFQGKATKVDAFYINEQFSCMLCGIGMDAQVAYEFALGAKRGLATYIRASIRNFFTYEPYRYSMSIENNKISGSAYFISVANSNQFGNNFTIAPRASLSDGLLDIIIVSAMSKPRLLFSILNQLRFGKALAKHEVTNDLKGIIYFQTDKLVIENPDYARLHIDGDPAKTDNLFSIKVLPKAFSLLVP
jgi:diacylglycerol kinase (ATP)